MAEIRMKPPAGKDVLRTKIVDELMRVLREAPFDEDDPTGPKLFSIVKRGNMDDIDIRNTPGCTVEEGGEQLEEGIYQENQKTLRLFFNVKVVKSKGVDPEPVINYYFGQIVRLLVTANEPMTAAGLVTDIAEAGNSIEAIGSTDPEPGGTLYLDVDYRHARGDWNG